MNAIGTTCRCGAVGTLRDVKHEGKEVLQVVACDACLARTNSEMDEMRGQFEELLAGGVSRAEANRIMIARIHGAPLS